jgi:hypothetical protein
MKLQLICLVNFVSSEHECAAKPEPSPTLDDSLASEYDDDDNIDTQCYMHDEDGKVRQIHLHNSQGLESTSLFRSRPACTDGITTRLGCSPQRSLT